MKNILFVGNSFTYFNDLPATVQTLADNAGIPLKTDSVTRGGAYLHDYVNLEDSISTALKDKYAEHPWDILVLQDQSSNPARDPDDFLAAARALVTGFPVSERVYFYQTWPYRDDTAKLASVHMSYDQLWQGLRDSYRAAASEAGGVCVPVGDAFRTVYKSGCGIDLYLEDDYHPAPTGTYLAACVFLRWFSGVSPLLYGDTADVSGSTADTLRRIAAEIF